MMGGKGALLEAGEDREIERSPWGIISRSSAIFMRVAGASKKQGKGSKMSSRRT